jgi:hypothetical protein
MLSTKKIGCFILSHQITSMTEIFLKKLANNFRKIAGDLDPRVMSSCPLVLLILLRSMPNN